MISDPLLAQPPPSTLTHVDLSKVEPTISSHEVQTPIVATPTTTPTPTAIVDQQGKDDKNAPQQRRTRHGHKQLGKYKLLRTLGEGEFGKVKLGQHLESHQKVAVKLVTKANLDPSSSRMEKIKREISVLKSIKHPFIVKLLDVIENDTHIGIILEYAPGGELFEYILDRVALSETKARQLFAQLISSVRYMHQKKIVHRDLKLENLLLNDDHSSILVTDFGFANPFDKDDLMTTSCGSPCYAAPELVMNTDGTYHGTAADVWSCGVILYAMLCGYLPFDDDPSNPEGQSVRRLYHYILATKLTFGEPISDDAKDIVLKMLQPDPAKRCTLDDLVQHPWLQPEHDLFTRDVDAWEREAEDRMTRLRATASTSDTDVTDTDDDDDDDDDDSRQGTASTLDSSPAMATPTPTHTTTTTATKDGSATITTPKKMDGSEPPRRVSLYVERPKAEDGPDSPTPSRRQRFRTFSFGRTLERAAHKPAPLRRQHRHHHLMRLFSSRTAEPTSASAVEPDPSRLHTPTERPMSLPIRASLRAYFEPQSARSSPMPLNDSKKKSHWRDKLKYWLLRRKPLASKWPFLLESATEWPLLPDKPTEWTAPCRPQAVQGYLLDSAEALGLVCRLEPNYLHLSRMAADPLKTTDRLTIVWPFSADEGQEMHMSIELVPDKNKTQLIVRHTGGDARIYVVVAQKLLWLTSRFILRAS